MKRTCVSEALYGHVICTGRPLGRHQTTYRVTRFGLRRLPRHLIGECRGIEVESIELRIKAGIKIFM